ncbi:MAG: hypothetical protein JWM05_36, partial [Acidimicrobiales bacterium]|nr:hypothetical protein [Acidimicrobiales bacterium]
MRRTFTILGVAAVLAMVAALVAGEPAHRQQAGGPRPAAKGRERERELGREPKEPLHERGTGSHKVDNASEQVANRAYPRGYVESARALAA